MAENERFLVQMIGSDSHQEKGKLTMTETTSDQFGWNRCTSNQSAVTQMVWPSLRMRSWKDLEKMSNDEANENEGNGAWAPHRRTERGLETVDERSRRSCFEPNSHAVQQDSKRCSRPKCLETLLMTHSGTDPANDTQGEAQTGNELVEFVADAAADDDAAACRWSAQREESAATGSWLMLLQIRFGPLEEDCWS